MLMVLTLMGCCFGTRGRSRGGIAGGSSMTCIVGESSQE